MEMEPLSQRFARSAYCKQIEETEIEESWNDKNETLMVYTAMKIKSLFKKHILAGEYYNRRYTLIMYPTIGLSTVSGLLGLNTFNIDEAIMQYVTSSVSIMTALLLSYMKFMQFGELAEAHNRVSKHYSTLYHKLARELFRDKTERVHADILIRQVGQESDDLFNVAPVVPEFIKQKTFNVKNWTIVSLRDQLQRERKQEYKLNDLEDPVYLSIRDPRYFQEGDVPVVPNRNERDPDHDSIKRYQRVSLVPELLHVFRSWKVITKRRRAEITPVQEEDSLEFDSIRDARGHV